MGWRSACISLCLALLVGGVCLAAPESPAAVSPGSRAGFTSVAGGCPTFSWGQVSGARSYELVVYQVAKGQVVELDSSSSAAIRERFPGTAQSWTPALGQCLAAGGSYAWSIRAVIAEGESPWSEASLFRVAAGPSLGEVEEALALLRRYVAEGGGVNTGVAVKLAGRDDQAVRDASEAVISAQRDPRDRATVTEDSSSPGPEALREEIALRRQQRRERMQGRAVPRALRSETLGLEGASGAPTVTPPASYSLVLDGDVALGGSIFKGGAPLLHTEGSANLALGLHALESNTLGTFNTALGEDALRNNDAGFSNVAVGSAALRDNTLGRWNTALGILALGLNINGTGNTASGTYALIRNEGGQWNAAVGYRALYDNITGDRNTAVGGSALEKTDADFNTAVGYGALRNNDIGESNIALGHLAGSLADSGSSNIFIGHLGVSGDSRTIRIGKVGFHQTASIGGDLGLGTEGPTNRLHVQEAISGSTFSNHVAAIENTLDNTGSPLCQCK